MRMPGKKDPEYFPLNLNMNLYEFESSFSCHPTFDPLEREDDEDGMSTDDELRAVADVLRSRSGSNANSHRPRRRVRNVSLNMSQNSDDEGEGDSMQSSSDLDLDGTDEGEVDEEVEVDMMDTLVRSINKKLRMEMEPQFSWTPRESTPPPTPYDPSTPSSTTPSYSHTHLRRRKFQPYPNSKARNPLLSVQKKASGPKHYWGGGRRAGSGKNPPSGESPYELLQELLSSGSLIKEAVRRLSTNQRLPSPVASPLALSPPTSRFQGPNSSTEEEASSLSAQ